MPRLGRALASVFAFTLGLDAAGQDGPRKDVSAIEEKVVAKAAERAVRSADGERGRWLKVLHKAYSGRVPEVAAESRVRGARATAFLEGAEFPVPLVRDVIRVAADLEQDGPRERVLRGAVQVTAASTPSQAEPE